MTRILLAALLIATPAVAHQHWGDLDGDGFLEPDEFDIGEIDFSDADLDGDGRISPAEYEAVAVIIASDQNRAVPEAAIDATDLGVDATPGPKTIEVD